MIKGRIVMNRVDMRHVKVAICIPAYNNVKSLDRLLKSILSQTYSDYVVCISDDSESKEIEELYFSFNDDRFHYHRNDMRLGATANNNQAMRIGQSYFPDYIKIMHHDDYFTYNYSLERYVYLMDKSPESEWIFSNFYVVYDDKKELGYASLSRLQEDRTLLVDGLNVVGQPSATMIKNNGTMMDESLTWLVDVDWYLKLMEYGDHYLYTEELLVSLGRDCIRLTDSCTRDRQLCMMEHLYLHQKYRLEIEDRHSRILLDKCIQAIKGISCEEGWYQDDYHAILKDTIRDNKKICIWGAGKIGITKAYKKLTKEGFDITCFCDSDESKWDRLIVNEVPCVSPDELMTRRGYYFCFIAVSDHKVYKEIEKLLVVNHIRCLPYIESYIDDFGR